MNNFICDLYDKMIKIYSIEDCDGLKYVGSTKRDVSCRLNEHKYEKKRGTSKSTSKKLNLENCIIRVLEECDEDKRNITEQKWINRLECVNINNLVSVLTPEENRIRLNKYFKMRRIYQHSWGGNERHNNNLLRIDVNLFT